MQLSLLKIIYLSTQLISNKSWYILYVTFLNVFLYFNHLGTLPSQVFALTGTQFEISNYLPGILGLSCRDLNP